MRFRTNGHAQRARESIAATGEQYVRLADAASDALLGDPERPWPPAMAPREVFARGDPQRQDLGGVGLGGDREREAYPPGPTGALRHLRGNVATNVSARSTHAERSASSSRPAGSTNT